MTWFKVDDGFYDHPKFINLSNAAIGLWVKSGAWCGRHLTDGIIPASQVKSLKGSKSQISALIEAGLWHETESASGLKCYRFHDWESLQPTREQKEKERAEGAERQRRSREKKAKQGQIESDLGSDCERSEFNLSSNRVQNESDFRVNLNSNCTESAFKSLQPKGSGQDQRENVTRDSHVTPWDLSQRPDPTRPDPTISGGTGSWLSHGEQRAREPEPAEVDPPAEPAGLTAPAGCRREVDRALRDGVPPRAVREAIAAYEARHGSKGPGLLVTLIREKHADLQQQARKQAAIDARRNCPDCDETGHVQVRDQQGRPLIVACRHDGNPIIFDPPAETPRSGFDPTDMLAELTTPSKTREKGPLVDEQTETVPRPQWAPPTPQNGPQDTTP